MTKDFNAAIVIEGDWYVAQCLGGGCRITRKI